MQLQLQSIIIENFKSLSGKHELALGKRGPGLHFIRGHNALRPRLGSNGVAKSSLFDALCWCLYGRTVGGLRTGDIVPWNGDSPTRVTLHYSLDGKKHSLQRQAGRIPLALDGRVHTDPAPVIPISFDTFINTILMGQDQPLFFDLTASGKMQLFTDVLDLNRWDKRASNAGKVARALQSDTDQLQGELITLQRQLGELKLMLQKVKQQSADWQTQWQQRLQTVAAEIKDLRRRLKIVQVRHDEATLAYDGANTEWTPLQREIRQLQEYVRIKNDEASHLQVSITLAEKERERINNDLQMIATGKCPTCGQAVKDKLHEHEQELRRELKVHSKLCNRGPLDALQKLGSDCTQQLTVLEKRERELKKQAEDARNTLDVCGPQLAELRTRLTLSVDQQNAGEGEPNPFEEQLSDLRKRHLLLASELEAKSKTHRIALRKIERTEFWVKGFKDLQLFIIEDVLAELELCSNAMTEPMGLIGWSIHYAVEKETKSGTIQRGLNVLIRSPTNKNLVKWECWSGGEGQRLRILGSLALSEVLLARAGIEPNMEVLDEPTQHLSPEGASDLTEYLADRAGALGRGIFYVDQVSVESTRFASVITVTRSKGGTRIEG